MRRSGSGRVPRKIGADDETPSPSTESPQSGAGNEYVVKRPTFAKNRKRSSLRISFGAGDAEGNDGDSGGDSAVITPKKSSLSRIAIEKNAEKRARSPLVRELPVPLSREDAEDEQPTYSKDYIAELRKSTPSTPKDLVATPEEDEESRAVDIASKFGPGATLSSLSLPTDSLIPTDAEIQEKKARRARLAKEQQAMEGEDEQPWASDDDDAFRTSRNEISLRPKEKYAETRLVRDDEDIAEGFEEYVDDGKIALGKKAAKQAEKQRRAEMENMINHAEHGSGDEEPDDSEEERNAAYEAAQTRAGMGKENLDADDGARTPPRITPLPDLGQVLEAQQADIRTKEERRAMLVKKLEELREDKVRIAERQQFLQEQLQKTGEEYEKLRLEAGMAAVNGTEATEGGKFILDRGLDSMGTTPRAPLSNQDSDDEGEEPEQPTAGRSRLMRF
ncbi:hypothetical protein M011DRAFT_483750 [Sporormia fimetaria CBS 119925]|uniref:Uncharacterized protein n=1 Tax=Sporormia fimetaria CBS 119925 TaxID=1340428 RepID=A0A6A6VJN4_9PLEO|nr:hypothetical protein M011DRAFT_483750 [Sporormia fimetaria CBS 119925]